MEHAEISRRTRQTRRQTAAAGTAIRLVVFQRIKAQWVIRNLLFNFDCCKRDHWRIVQNILERGFDQFTFADMRMPISFLGETGFDFLPGY